MLCTHNSLGLFTDSFEKQTYILMKMLWLRCVAADVAKIRVHVKIKFEYIVIGPN